MAKIIVLTMCPNGGCPRIGITGKSTFFKDDYNGKVNMTPELLRKLSALK